MLKDWKFIFKNEICYIAYVLGESLSPTTPAPSVFLSLHMGLPYSVQGLSEKLFYAGGAQSSLPNSSTSECVERKLAAPASSSPFWQMLAEQVSRALFFLSG